MAQNTQIVGASPHYRRGTTQQQARELAHEIARHANERAGEPVFSVSLRESNRALIYTVATADDLSRAIAYVRQDWTRRAEALHVELDRTSRTRRFPHAGEFDEAAIGRELAEILIGERRQKRAQAQQRAAERHARALLAQRGIDRVAVLGGRGVVVTPTAVPTDDGELVAGVEIQGTITLDALLDILDHAQARQ